MPTSDQRPSNDACRPLGAWLLAAGFAIGLAVDGAAAACDPTGTAPVFAGAVPTPRALLGIDLGQRDVTVAEADRYLLAVSRATARVVDGVLATSLGGRPLRYAIVGLPDNVTAAALTRISAAAKSLRDPATPPAEVARLAASMPAILWVAGNVHGDEESGTDAALRVLWELADRTDCAARGILDNAIVVILPTQNPDGRSADTRGNGFGIDMNRDWFARTQPETDGKIELMRRYPPVLFIDAHEMPRDRGFFFPPNADPVYHESGETQIGWINGIYGPALAGEFRSRGIPFFSRRQFDLFYAGYGDTVPILGFGAAGMTFEKGGTEAAAVRVLHQHLAQWVTLSAAAARRRSLNEALHASFLQAYQQGVAGTLERNVLYNPGQSLSRQVPTRLVRHYFLRADEPGKGRERALLVRRLQRMDVTVFRLTAPLTVPDFRPYGRAAARTTLPTGTYWVPLAQSRKHWVQAMLNEDTYTPFPYFYDVTAWSLPLLANIAGGASGAQLTPSATRVAAVGAPAAVPRPPTLPRIALLDLSAVSPAARESVAFMRQRLERDWRLPYRRLAATGLASALTSVDVLLVPNLAVTDAERALGAGGRGAIANWVRNGGRYVGWRGGAGLAIRLGVSVAAQTAASSAVPGSLFRVRVDRESPLAQGVGATVWQHYQSDPLLRPGNPAQAAATYPPVASADWFVSGFERGASELAGTAAVTDEAVGQGRTVLFAGEPNFRAYTDGTARMLLNAVLGGDPTRRVAAQKARPATALAAADDGAAIRVMVRLPDRSATAALLRTFTAGWDERRSGDWVTFVIPNPQALHGDEHPWARELPAALDAAGVDPIAVVVP